MAAGRGLVAVVVLVAALGAGLGSPTALRTQSSAAAPALRWQVSVDTTRPVARVDAGFATTTIDIHQILDGSFNLSTPRMVRLVSALGGHGRVLRVSGTRIDTTQFVDNSSSPLLPGYEKRLTKAMLEEMCTFARATGFSVLLGVNAGVGPRGNSERGAWQPDNLRPMLAFLAGIGCPLRGLEFSNEPNLFPLHFQTYVAPAQMAADFAVFAAAVAAVNASWETVGLDVGILPVLGELTDFYPGFFDNLPPGAAAALDAVTYHFYPLLGGSFNKSFPIPPALDPFFATPGKLLDPLILDQVGHAVDKVLAAMEAPSSKVLRNSTRLYLGETGSSVGGGQPHVSNAFVDGFEYVDKLGQVALRGRGAIVMRQTICSAGYPGGGLIPPDSGPPHPPFWNMLLAQQLLGEDVYTVSTRLEERVPPPGVSAVAEEDLRLLRLYASCARSGQGVVVSFVHISNHSSEVVFAGGVTRVEAYVVTSADGTLTSDTSLLNGRPLGLSSNGSVPLPLPAAAVSAPGGVVQIPPLSYGFLHLPEISVPCGGGKSIGG